MPNMLKVLTIGERSARGDARSNVHSDYALPYARVAVEDGQLTEGYPSFSKPFDLFGLSVRHQYANLFFRFFL
jgi:hypothetical protein